MMKLKCDFGLATRHLILQEKSVSITYERDCITNGNDYDKCNSNVGVGNVFSPT